MIEINKNVYLDENNNLLFSYENKRPITEKEKRLLVLLISAGINNKILTRDEIIATVWEERCNGVNDANILQLVCKLRRTLTYCHMSGCIQTIPRKGYIFIPPSENSATNLIFNKKIKPFLSFFFKKTKL